MKKQFIILATATIATFVLITIGSLLIPPNEKSSEVVAINPETVARILPEDIELVIYDLEEVAAEAIAGWEEAVAVSASLAAALESERKHSSDTTAMLCAVIHDLMYQFGETSLTVRTEYPTNASLYLIEETNGTATVVIGEYYYTKEWLQVEE
jgi:hypothetical protein